MPNKERGKLADYGDAVGGQTPLHPVPIPHSTETSLSARKAATPVRLSTAKLRGLSRSETSLARNLLSLKR